MPVQLWQQPLESVAYAAGSGQTKTNSRNRKWEKEDRKKQEQNDANMAENEED